MLAKFYYFVFSVLQGTVLLTLSVSEIPRHYRETVFFIALYTIAIGEGGHKPCVQAFAADQFDENNTKERAAKSSFFNWWYLGIMSGASLAVVAVAYLQVITNFLSYFFNDICFLHKYQISFQSILPLSF